MKEITDFINYVNNNYLGEIKTNLSFKDITTLKIGGQIACYYLPKTLDDLVLSYKFLKKKQIPYLVIGNGSNILASDKYFEMVVINLKKLKQITQIDQGKFLVEAGINNNRLALYLAKQGYTRGEFLSVIPGTFGGAIYMNAGAYQTEIKDILKEVTYITSDGQLVTKVVDELAFSYRHSHFQDIKGIIVNALIEVELAKIKTFPLEKIYTLRKTKKNTQPLNLSSAGSTFKNPLSYEAWQIIDNLGYRGFKIHDAMVSMKHSNYLVNMGNATYEDMMSLINLIKTDAKNQYNIELECEWEILN